MGDFLAINGRSVGIAVMNVEDSRRYGSGRGQPAYGDEAIFWYLAFASVEDAREWYDISAMEF